MKQYLKKYSLLLVLLGVLIYLIYYLSAFGIIAHSDSYHGYNAYFNFNRYFFSWDNIDNGGKDMSFRPTLFTMAFASFLNFINLSLASAGLIFVLFLFIWFFSYKIVTYIVPIPKNKYSLHFIVILLCSMSILLPDYKAYLSESSTIFWGLMFSTITFYYYLKAIYERNLLYIVIAAIFLQCAFIDVSAVLLFVFYSGLFTFSYFAYLLLDGKIRSVLSLIKLLIFFVILNIGLNAYWILLSVNLTLTSTSQLNTFLSSSGTTDSILSFTSSLNALGYNILLGRENLFINKYYPSYLLIIEIIFMLSFIFSCFVSVLFFKRAPKNSKKSLLYPLYLLLLVMLLLSFGPSDIFGVFNFFWEHLPGFKVFRNFFKFHRVLSLLYPIFATLLLASFYDSLRPTLKKVILILSILLFIVRLYPFIYGFRVYAPFHIPNAYFEFAEYGKSLPRNTHVMYLPVIAWHQTFSWSNPLYDMADPFAFFSTKPSYISSAAYVSNVLDLINQNATSYLVNDQLDSYLKLLGVRNIGYLVLRYDHNQNYLKRISDNTANVHNLNISAIKKALDDLVSVGSVTHFDGFDLYEIPQNSTLPLFYSANKISYTVADPADAISELVKIDNLRDIKIFYKQNLNLVDLISEETELSIPKIKFKQINPTKYRVQIFSSGEKFFLVFIQNFSDNWKVFLNPSGITTPSSTEDYVSPEYFDVIQDNNLLAGPYNETWNNKFFIAEKNHYVVNAFANGWVVESDYICSLSKSACTYNSDGSVDFELIVEFVPQKTYIIGFIITGVFYLLGIGSVVLVILKRVFRKK